MDPVKEEEVDIDIDLDEHQSLNIQDNLLIRQTSVVAKLKIVLVGDSGVGKSFLLNTYLSRFVDTINSTGRVENSSSTSSAEILLEGNPVHVTFIDTQDSDSLRQKAYKDADLILLVFSLAAISSLDHIEGKWIPELQRCAPGVGYILVGSQLDRWDDEDEKHVMEGQPQDIALKLKCAVHLVRPTDNEGVITCFTDALGQAYASNLANIRRNKPTAECCIFL